MLLHWLLILFFSVRVTICIFNREPYVRSKLTSYVFTTCGVTGSTGPTQSQCDDHYTPREETLNQKTIVTINQEMPGVQIWTVPKNETYRLTAIGANGGFGSRTKEIPSQIYGMTYVISRRADAPIWAASVTGEMSLRAGWKLYILVGQTGSWACDKTSSSNNFCGPLGNVTAETDYHGGGAGGGGASLIALKRSPHAAMELIMLANGGGGMGRYDINSTFDYQQALKKELESTDTDNISSTPGIGGAYLLTRNQSNTSTQLNSTVINFATSVITGSRGCEVSRKLGFDANGGFGGGGGGCSAGGGGGGYTGGLTSRLDNPGLPGAPGTSFTNDQLLDKVGIEKFNIFHGPQGYVEVMEIPPMCPDCEYGRCEWFDKEYKTYQCYACQPGYEQSANKLTCNPKFMTLPSSYQIKKTSSVTLTHIIVILAGSLFIMLTVAVVIKVSRRRQVLFIKPSETSTNLFSQSNQVTNDQFISTTSNSLYIAYDQQLPTNISIESINIIERLGEGEFSKVYKAKLNNGGDWNSTEIDVALKIPKGETNDSVIDQELIQEAAMISSLEHKNIIKILGVCYELPYFGGHKMAIVMELLSGGDLKSFLATNKPTQLSPFSDLTLGELIKISSDVVSACIYLEEKKFIHRDIAARNVLLTEKGSERVAKISDFGRSRDIADGEYVTQNRHRKKPVKWLPPEGINDSAQSTKSDVWSFGILLWEIFTMGELPYPGHGNEEVSQSVRAGLRMQPPEITPRQIADVMRQCWMYYPVDRPSFSYIQEVINIVTQNNQTMSKPIHLSQLTFHKTLKCSVTSSTSSYEDRIDSPTGFIGTEPGIHITAFSYRQETQHTEAA